MKHNTKHAFTLVELIVVITILAVLATVAFISFQGYTSLSRDSVRLSDMKNISKSFEINRTKGIDFPLPDKKVDITSSGTVFQYQGELTQEILTSELNIFDGGIDPLTGENYGYAVNAARNKFQITGFLENPENIANISLNKTFADNSDKYVRSSGDSLGIILDENTNEIIVQSGSLTQIDIENTTQSYAFVVKKSIETGGDDFLKNEFAILENPIASCKAILYAGKDKGNGIYTINPTNIEGQDYEVYCDMVNYGGGWTLLLANREDTTRHTSSSENKNLTTLPNYDNWNYTKLNTIDDFIAGNKNVVSQSIEDMKFQDIRFECVGENCLGSGVGIYTHINNSLLQDKTGVFTLKGDKAWPFDQYYTYMGPGDRSESNRVPYDELQIGAQCLGPTSTRVYKACVQIGITGVDNYNFPNSIGLGVYGKEWYKEVLEINAPLGYVSHRIIESLNANVWIK